MLASACGVEVVEPQGLPVSLQHHLLYRAAYDPLHVGVRGVIEPIYG